MISTPLLIAIVALVLLILSIIQAVRKGEDSPIYFAVLSAVVLYVLSAVFGGVGK